MGLDDEFSCGRWKDALETMACHAGVTSIGFAEDTYLGLLSFNVTNGVVLDIGRDRTQIVAYLNGIGLWLTFCIFAHFQVWRLSAKWWILGRSSWITMCDAWKKNLIWRLKLMPIPSDIWICYWMYRDKRIRVMRFVSSFISFAYFVVWAATYWRCVRGAHGIRD